MELILKTVKLKKLSTLPAASCAYNIGTIMEIFSLTNFVQLRSEFTIFNCAAFRWKVRNSPQQLANGRCLLLETAFGRVGTACVYIRCKKKALFK